MDSQFFNRKRFITLCRWDWTERQKALGLQAVVIYAVLTVFSGFYTIRGALRANALSHYVSPQRVEEWKAISADLAQGVDGSWTSVSVLFFPILAFYLVGTARRTQRALQATSQATRTLTFPVGRGYITGATAPRPCRGLRPCDPIFINDRGFSTD